MNSICNLSLEEEIIALNEWKIKKKFDKIIRASKMTRDLNRSISVFDKAII